MSEFFDPFVDPFTPCFGGPLAGDPPIPSVELVDALEMLDTLETT